MLVVDRLELCASAAVPSGVSAEPGGAGGQAEPVICELLGGLGDVRYVWRHLPLTDVHVHAQIAAEAAEAAAVQGRYW